MSEIEKMKRYIERTKIAAPTNYELGVLEANAIKNAEDALDAVYMAFLYGRAKGYRAAKAEGRAKA